ncbi:unnamed protein product [Toxocara canis]|uniref:protein-tyrosine-phosphatase n=1 Tax=Toxocara canis TaxID=6265 RepID=A0A183UBQ7_TOXCA|nr:unnamed protein product [Toxocara canis]
MILPLRSFRTCMACRPAEIRLPCIRALRDQHINVGNTEIPKEEFVQRLKENRDDFDIIDREFELIHLHTRFQDVIPEHIFLLSSVTQFQVLNRGFPNERKSIIQNIDNMRKNRFMDVLPYDENRVKIKNHHSDYINASFIDGYDKPKKYIAAQGPIGYNETNQGKRESTVEDFYIMLWEQRVHCIVMLTECVENLRLKCAQYWPEEVDAECHYGNIRVRLVSSSSDNVCTQREMSVTYDGQTRTVVQWHYKEWQDCKGPQDAKHLIDFIRRVQRSSPKTPILVHCSAGVGRTGVFIALDILLQHIKRHSTVDIFGCVRKLREQRVRMVQTVEQYITLYEAVALAIQESDTTISSVPSRKFENIDEFVCENPFTEIAINA